MDRYIVAYHKGLGTDYQDWNFPYSSKNVRVLSPLAFKLYSIKGTGVLAVL